MYFLIVMVGFVHFLLGIFYNVIHFWILPYVHETATQ